MRMRSFFSLFMYKFGGLCTLVAFGQSIYFIHTIYASNALIVKSRKVKVNSSGHRLTFTGLSRQQVRAISP